MRIERNRRRVVMAFAALAPGGAFASLACGAEINVPGDYPTIQAAIDASNDGDVVNISAGSWFESIEIIGTAVTLRGPDVGTASIRGDGVDPILKVSGGTAPVVLEDITFRDSLVGGVVVEGADVDFRSCNFASIESTAYAGAAAALNDGTFRFFDCLLSGNTSTQAASTLAITNGTLVCEETYFGSTSSATGTGVLIDDSSATIQGCRFNLNSGDTYAAMVGVGDTVVTMTNTLIDSNTDVVADPDGAPIGILGDATMKIFSCTFRANTAAVMVGGDGTLVMMNSIVPAGTSGLFGSSLFEDVRYCLLQGGHPGVGNINGTPLYETNPSQTFQLRANSPGVDAADASAIDPSLVDLYGHSRVVDDLEVADVVSPLDMGCAERIPPVRYVNYLATGKSNGQTWDDAYINPIDAIEEMSDRVSPVEEVWVARGEYPPDRGTNDRDATFVMRSGLALYGGFGGGETSRGDADPRSNTTVLTGKIGGVSPTDNVRHVVTAMNVDETGVIDGFSIVDGFASGTNDADRRGAAILIEGGGPRVQRCVITRNNGEGKGYVVRVFNADAHFDSCRIEANGTIEDGVDAVRLEGGAPVMRNTAIVANRLEGNGALHVDGIEALKITNVTIAGNVATTDVLAGLVIRDTNLFLFNAVICENSGGSGVNAQMNFDAGSTVEGSACSVAGYFGGFFDAAIACDGIVPRFVNRLGPDNLPATGDEDFRLERGACAIDAGMNIGIVTGFGDARQSTRLRNDPGTPDTGNAFGDPAVVDRGAYEFQSTTCKGDINLNGDVGFADLTSLLSQIGVCSGACAADLDCSSVVDFADLITLLTAWGPCAP